VTGQRYYTWRGQNYWSVTTIIKGGLPMPALLNWGIKMVAEGAADLADTLPRLVEHDRDAAVKMLKGLPWSNRTRAADLGSLIHAAVEARALGQPMPEPPAIARTRMQAFYDFLADCEPVFLATEASVYNRLERYAGTLDAIVEMFGRRYLLDYKTGKGVYPEVALQLAAYRYADFIGLPDGSEAPMPKVDAAACLHLPEDGGYELIDVRADPEVFDSFLYVREVYRWQEELSKAVLLGPIHASALTQATVPLANLLGETPPPSSQGTEIPY
jgi:hypothetical protein